VTYEQWIDAYGAAWRAKDSAAAADLFTEDGIYRSSPTDPPHVGRSAIIAYWDRATAPQRDLDLRFGTAVVARDRVAVEWWATMRDPEWRPEASCDWVTLPGCLLLRFTRDGRCRELREYYNPLFGVVAAAPEGWGR
jgi:uncharacterized protein (TIGR02246 family)